MDESPGSESHMSGYPAGMSETTHQYGYADARVRDISTAQLLGQVMFLVAVAIGFCALGTLLGRDLSVGTARICSFAGFGMLLVSSFAGARFRVGAFAMGWLFATALVIGLGLGPVIAYYASVEPNALTQAFAGTAATVAGAGALGFVLSKDLARWMRPLSLLVFAACAGTIVWTLVAGSISPVVSLIIYALSAALIVVDFNYIRKHGTENDAIWLATGIFVSIVNIFVSLLNIFSGR
jgi:modulator of FtsH protease